MPQIYVFPSEEQNLGAEGWCSYGFTIHPPILANVFLESFEQESFQLAKDKPRLWVRYEDDTFVIWQHGLDKLEPFQQHLNSLRNPIKFTMETETKGQLHLLDVLVKRDGDKLTISVFSKRTYTDQYLHYRSHHQP